MEKNVNITREELNELMREIERVKSTIEILQDEEMMGQVKESERLEKEGAELLEIDSEDV